MNNNNNIRQIESNAITSSDICEPRPSPQKRKKKKDKKKKDEEKKDKKKK